MAQVFFSQKATKRFLDANENEKVYSLSFNGGYYQKWRLVEKGDTFEIIHNKTGNVLDSNKSGNVYLHIRNEGPYQKWKATEIDKGYFIFTNIATGKVLDGNNNGEIYTHPINRGDYQKWKVLAVQTPITIDMNRLKKIQFGSIERFIYENQDTILLFESRQHADRIDFPDPNPDREYHGCGIKVAQNMLKYLGIEMTQDEIKKQIPTNQIKLPRFDFEFLNKIWVYPKDLEENLQNIFNTKGLEGIITKRYTDMHLHPDRIKEYLRYGVPLIALVDNGGHYILVVGYHQDIGYIVLDNYTQCYRCIIDTDFDGASEFAAFIVSLGDSSFKPGTIIIAKK